MRLILASASPRRKELLGLITPDFEIIPSNAEEEASGAPAEIVKALAAQKASYVYAQTGDKKACVLGSDTIVVQDGQVLGKPKDDEDAMRMLRSLSGRKHYVYTGICLVGEGFTEAQYICAEVYFDELSEDELLSYIATGDGRDKAGSYGIQSCGGKFIKKIDGDWSCVMGLPLNATYRLLKKYGVVE